MATNINYLFYKKYFQVDSEEAIKKLNSTIYETKIVPINPIYQKSCTKDLETTYPGLLIGSGYQHDYKNPDDKKMQEEAFKIGFFFDYTTGMPIIPGSSIKGALRSCFPQKSVKKRKKLPKEYMKSREAFIKKILKEDLLIKCDIDVDVIENEIFHGIRNGKSIPQYKRDVFLQAVPIEVKNSENKLFYNDYITPHAHVDEKLSYEANLLKNPIPLKFLKVAPKVIYRFEFKLQNSQVCDDLTAEKKLELLIYLIRTIGLGAKTNVGYGQFNLTSLNKKIIDEQVKELKRQEGEIQMASVNNNLEVNSIIEVAVKSFENGKVTFYSNEFRITLPEKKIKEFLKKGDKRKIKILSLGNKISYQYPVK